MNNPINNSLFVRNRLKLRNKLQLNTLAIIAPNQLMLKSRDQYFPYHQNSDLYYFSGIEQSNTYLLIYLGKTLNEYHEILFIEKPDPLKELWNGNMKTKEQSAEISGIEHVMFTEELEEYVATYLGKTDIVLLNYTSIQEESEKFSIYPNRLAKIWEPKLNGKQMEPLGLISDPIRMVKENIEINEIRKAINITRDAFLELIPVVKPGNNERNVSASIYHTFLNQGSRTAFDTIAASGINSCILHYSENCEQLKSGEILLVDFGASIHYYNADVTRVFPIDSTFTDRQKAVYQSVLSINKKVMQEMTPGKTLNELQKITVSLMEEAMVNLGLFSMNDLKEQDNEKPLYKSYFPHNIGHYLGIDVHDVGNRDEPLRPGMIITCEPGIYIKAERIGIRLENDILINETGNENLTSSIPIEIEEIEQLRNNL